MLSMHELRPSTLESRLRWSTLILTWGGSARLFYFFLVAGPVRNAPERSWHASGPIFSPNRRFWTRFGPFLVIWPEPTFWAGLGQAMDWPGGLGTRPGTGWEALAARPAYFFFSRIKKRAFLFFGGGSGTPPPSRKKPDFFIRRGSDPRSEGGS